ncbi:uncharacterized protein LOC119072837 isoform X2 [Bradysia coprophila]|uniref:uncharacterized protein LOC119072837 isoform X2 n=1 Tax=Bradysia coprophila TaxID=38358 RepID=UPI00187D757F|nr:uncharacterized protein LOC119072837 isoform X2 [Bradysia coprophila]
MEQINNYTTLCLIDNFGCTRSVDDGTLYLCFIGNCIFETADLGELLSHLDVHNEKWFGFCHSCNDQIHDNKVSLLVELQHWNKCHRNEIGFSVVFQPDDKRNKLREAVDNARVKLLASDDESDFQFICLKPWNNTAPETQKKCRKMLSKGCLYALYKCMDRNCAFYTSCDQGMLSHLEYHEKCAANTAIAELSWLECAYCDVVSDTCSSLVQHIREEHRSSAYQCPYCFYRSCTACNVLYHLKTFHESRASSVLVCRAAKKFHPAERTVVQKSRSNYVFPLRCSEVCNEITYRMDYFINHLKTAHDNHFKCQFCGLNIPILEAIQHLSVHNIGVYQCIYCLCGANDIDSIQSHMCHAHPARLPYICVRLTRKNRILRDDELTSADSTFISKLSHKVHSKWLKMCPYTDEELLNNPLGLTTVEPIPRPPLDFSENSSLIDNDLPFDGQDVVSYDDLKRDYSNDNWNEYFTTIRPIDGMSESKVDVDEGFGDDTCTNTTISQMDRSEPDSVPDDSEERKPANRDSGLSILDDVSQSICSSRLDKPKVEPKSTIEPFTKFSDPKLPDVFRYRCAYCPKPFINLQPVYEHWYKEHGKPNVTFMFQVTKIFKCCYCRHCNTYDDLKRHCEQKHPKETFAIIDKMNQKKCALCTSLFCNASTELIADHFEQHHNVAGINNTIRLESYLTDEWLDKIVADKVFRRGGLVSNQIMYDCPYCPTARCNDQSEMVAHIRKHFLRFKCNCCDKTFEKIGLLEKHHAITHAKDKALSVVSANENLGNYLEMKIIFPNGFMLTKRECVNTRFGATDELVKMIQELNGSDMEIGLAKPAQRISKPNPMITRSKGTAERARSSSSSKLNCGCSDDVDRRKSRLRPRSVETGKKKEWPMMPCGVTTRKRSNQSKTGK